MKNSENKGLNWTGNIYHKFEGIIPDVNDMTIQDTFKYVENHVHNVGGSFKKFCSDVVQDFFPLSMDSVKHEANTVPPEENSATTTDDCPNSEISVVETSAGAVVKQSPAVTEATDHVAKQLGLVSSGGENADEHKDTSFTEGHKITDSVSAPMRTNELTNENSDPRKMNVNDMDESLDGLLELPPPGTTESFGPSLLDDFIDAQRERKRVVLPDIKIECPSSEGAFCDVLSQDTECDLCALSSQSETAFAAVSGEDAVTGTGLLSSANSPLRYNTSPPRYLSDVSCPGASDGHKSVDLAGCVSDSPQGRLSLTPASAISTDYGVVEKQLVSSSSHLSLESVASKGCSDDSSVDYVDSGMETINLHDEVKLGESCVFVDDTVLYAVSRRARKLGSYKKKIQDIFASKKRLAKEYEQLAIWYGDTDIDSSPDAQNLPARQSCDSEWELL